jgi:hypothetical protein
MRTSILAIIVAFGATIAVPALAQPSQQKQDDAAKDIKTHDSSTSSGAQDSGIAGDVTVREQAQKPASTTGTTSGTQDSGISGDVTVREQEQKPASTTGTTKSR